MIVCGKNLALLYFYDYALRNLPEIEKEQYGYDLQPGQILVALRYHGSNMEVHFHVVVHYADDTGVYISDSMMHDITIRQIEKLHPERIKEDSGKTIIFVPWEAKLLSAGKLVDCDLYIEPCDTLYEKNKLEDILAGKIQTEGKMGDVVVKGIWHKHGGWRDGSRYGENLRNFIKMGQQQII